MERRQPGEIHPEQFVVHPDPAHHDLQLVQVGTGLAQGIQLDGVVHPADLQDLQVGPRVAEEESLQVCRVVLVVEIQVEFRYGVVGSAELTEGGQGTALGGDDLQLGDDAGE